MSHSRQISVKQTNEHEIDREFQTIRDKFDEEMRKMEAEMSRFRSKISDREREIETCSPTSKGKQISSFIETIESPLITNTSDGKALKLKFDVTDYAPEEIIVKTVDNKLQVHAKHEEKSDSRSVLREYNREFLLPEGTNPEQVKSSLSREGVLTVQVPLPKSEHKRIPIDKH